MSKQNHISNGKGKKAKALSGRITDEDLFLVPEGYFDGITERIINRIGTQDAKIRKFNYRWVFAIAATVTVIISVALIFMPDGGRNEFPDLFVDAGTNIPELFLDELSEVLIYDALAQLNFESDDYKLPGSIIPESDTSLSEDDILDYLLYEGFTEKDLLTR